MTAYIRAAIFHRWGNKSRWNNQELNAALVYVFFVCRDERSAHHRHQHCLYMKMCVSFICLRFILSIQIDTLDNTLCTQSGLLLLFSQHPINQRKNQNLLYLQRILFLVCFVQIFFYSISHFEYIMDAIVCELKITNSELSKHDNELTFSWLSITSTPKRLSPESHTQSNKLQKTAIFFGILFQMMIVNSINCSIAHIRYMVNDKQFLLFIFVIHEFFSRSLSFGMYCTVPSNF